MKKGDVRVLHLFPRFEGGGAEKTIYQIATGMLEYHYQAVIGSSGGNMFGYLKERRITWVKLPLYPSNFINLCRSYFELNKIVDRYQIDLIHSHHRFTNIMARLVGSRCKIPGVVTVHDLAGGRRFISRFGLGKHVQVFSEAVRQHLITHFGLEAKYIHKIPMGIPPVSHRRLEEIMEIKKQYGCSEGEPIIGFVGRLVSEKGPDQLLAATPQVLNKCPAAKIWIIGDGDLRHDLELQASKLGIRNNVIFFGGQEDVSKFISCFDVAVVPSVREGFGLAALEALAHGKPVIAAAVGALPELIENGKNGILISPGKNSELAEAIITIISDQKLLTRMGESAKEMVQGRFAIKDMLDGINEIYQIAIREKLGHNEVTCE